MDTLYNAETFFFHILVLVFDKHTTGCAPASIIKSDERSPRIRLIDVMGVNR